MREGRRRVAKRPAGEPWNDLRRIVGRPTWQKSRSIMQKSNVRDAVRRTDSAVRALIDLLTAAAKYKHGSKSKRPANLDVCRECFWQFYDATKVAEDAVTSATTTLTVIAGQDFVVAGRPYASAHEAAVQLFTRLVDTIKAAIYSPKVDIGGAALGGASLSGGLWVRFVLNPDIEAKCRNARLTHDDVEIMPNEFENIISSPVLECLRRGLMREAGRLVEVPHPAPKHSVWRDIPPTLDERISGKWQYGPLPEAEQPAASVAAIGKWIDVSTPTLRKHNAQRTWYVYRDTKGFRVYLSDGRLFEAAKQRVEEAKRETKRNEKKRKGKVSPRRPPK